MSQSGKRRSKYSPFSTVINNLVAKVFQGYE